MGFNKVYRSLQEVFPQVDARALKAVAIEHSKDADAAVEAVLVEIIPFFTERSMPKMPSTWSSTVAESSKGSIANAQTSADCASGIAAAGLNDGQNGCITNARYQDFLVDAIDGHSEPLCDIHSGHCEGDDVVAELTMRGSALEKNMQQHTGICSRDEAVELTGKDRVNALQIEVSIEPKTISDRIYPANSIQLVSDTTDRCQTLGNSKEKNAGIDRNMSIVRERADSGCLEIDLDTSTNKDSDLGKNSQDGKTCVIEPSSFIAHDIAVGLPENVPMLHELDGSLPNNIASKMEPPNIIAGTDDESANNGSISQSSKIDMIDALARIIVDARNNKKMLFSAMDSVISLMREVELKEKASKQAKVEVSMGGTDILIKSEELNQMVKQAEGTNSMRAGEVYSEKAILATELRELQSRALSLSVERDKYLAFLDEMQQTLKERLAEAQNLIISAEQEKVEKEKVATESPTEYELIMEKVLQESKSLNQQAEDNARLRQFLVDRGHVVDTLQEEISVVCEDVRVLKEKLDDHMSFIKSLSPIEISCISATSKSSSKSSVPEQVESLPVEGDDPMDTQAVGSCATERSSQDEAATNDRKGLLDDEWEIFDHDILA